MFIKKSLMICSILSAICLNVSVSSAQVKPSYPRVNTQPGVPVILFNDQQPLTQKDIDAYLKFYPAEKKAKKENKLVQNDLYHSCGVSPERAAYVKHKVSIVYPYCGKEDAEYQILSTPQTMTHAIHPTLEELALVRSNLNAIEKIYAEK